MTEVDKLDVTEKFMNEELVIKELVTDPSKTKDEMDRIVFSYIRTKLDESIKNIKTEVEKVNYKVDVDVKFAFGSDDG